MKKLIILILCMVLISCGNQSNTMIMNDEKLLDEVSQISNQEDTNETSSSNNEVVENDEADISESDISEDSSEETKENISTSDDQNNNNETTSSDNEVVASKENISTSDDQSNANESLEEMAIFDYDLYGYNKEFLSQISEQDYVTPYNEQMIIEYESIKSDVIDTSNFTHKGFKDVVLNYSKWNYFWTDFNDEWTSNGFSSENYIKLSGDNFYEYDSFDEFETTERYYKSDEGIYYEVVSTYNNDTDTTTMSARSCNYKALGKIIPPSSNPLSLDNNEKLVRKIITTYDGQEVVYLEVLRYEYLVQKWVSISDGVLLKSLEFDQQGLLKKSMTLTSIDYRSVEEQVFVKPSDVAFKDITLFIYQLEGGDLDTFRAAVESTVPAEPNQLLLTSADQTQRIYNMGLDGMELDDPIYYSKSTDDNGLTTTLRFVQSNRFYTICDEMEIVEIYDESCYEKKFFNFEDVALLEVGDDFMTFYDPNNISVSGLYDVYKYFMSEGKISRIDYYSIDSITHNLPETEVVTYLVSLGDFDETIYDESCMDTYKIVDHGQGSFNDGEHMPFWYNRQ